MRCLGKTNKNTPCRNRCVNSSYCRFHKKETIEIKEKEIEESIGDCSICLCDVDEEQDCRLICGHIHHIECIKQLNKAECPVCRGPLEFKKNIDIHEIIKREEKELENNKNQTMAEDLLYANELHRENDIDDVLQESLRTYETDEYEYISNILKYSYEYAQMEDEELLKQAIDQNLLIEKEQRQKESIHDTINRLMKGEKSIIVHFK